MKMIIAILTVLASTGASAKVADFNALIDENIQAQKALHQEVQTQTEVTRHALRNGKEAKEVFVVESGSDTVNVPTRRELLRFKKEIVNHRLSQKDSDRRLANEFKDVDLEF